MHWQRFTATWYSPEGGWGTGTVTATGEKAQEGTTVAVDPRVIPLGATVVVRFADGRTHLYKATDTGGAIKGNRIDIFDWSEQECRQNGVQTVFVTVLH